MQKITHLFDLGGVILDFDFRPAAEIWANYGNTSINHIAEKFSHNDYYKKHEKGEISIVEYHQSINKIFGFDITLEQFLEGWNSIFKGLFVNIENKLKELSKKEKIYALTNTNATHVKVWSKMYPQFFNIFEKIYISNEIGSRKPDFECYAYITKDLNIKPEQIKFYDDTFENIEAAGKFGYNTFHVTNIDELEVELTKYL